MPRGVYKHKKGYKRPPFSKEWKDNIGKSGKGRRGYWKDKKFSEEHIGNMKKAREGYIYIPWNKDKKLSEKHIEKLRKSHIGTHSGKDNPAYKDGRCQSKEYVSWLKGRNGRKKRNAEGTHTFAEWELLKKQYGYRCPCCGGVEPFNNQRIKGLTEDHIIPLDKGGSNFIENIQPLCMRCNLKKHTKVIRYTNL